MPEHDLGPLVVQELGVPAGLPQLQQHLAPQLDGLVVVHQVQPGARLCLVDDPGGELVDVDHIHPVEEFGAAEQQQPLPQVDGEVLVERREQHVLAGAAGRQPLDQPSHAVQRDDGLAGARAPADPGRAAVGPFDDPPLDGVQVYLPAFEASLQDGLQRFVVGGDEGRGAVGRRRVVASGRPVPRPRPGR